MPARGKRQTIGVARLALTVLLVAFVVALLAVQLLEGLASAGRTVGVYFEERQGRLVLEQVLPGLPAEQAGLRAGDIVIEVEGRAIADGYDYDLVAEDYSRGRPVAFRVEREGREVGLELVPGVPWDWRLFAANAAAGVLHLALALLVLASRLRGPQATLLTVLLLAIAVEMALPLELVGKPALYVAALTLYWLLSGTQFSVELHLASMLPERQPWTERRGWIVNSFYVVGLGCGVLFAASEIPALAGSPATAWLFTSAGTTFVQLWLMIWPVAVVVILVRAALKWPTGLGRQQVLLVLLGLAPWAVLTLVLNTLDLQNQPIPSWMQLAQPLVLVLYPLTMFVALYRFQLFDFQMVVRRSAIYTALTTSLVLVFYGTLGAAGAFLSTFVEDPTASVWVIAGATLTLGLLFGPLRSLLESLIERQFFPERTALRRRLGDLSRDLPKLGNLPAICEELVRQFREIFDVGWVHVLLVEGKSGLLVSRASSSDAGETSLAFPALLSANDPYVDALRQANRSLPLERWRSRSQVARRFVELGVAGVHPVVKDSELVGLLLLGEKEGGRDFSAEEIELLDLFTHHVATVLDNATLFESATTDGLTGLLRREPLLVRLDDELERAIRYERPLTVGLIDVDQFKEINDRLGHLTGDVVLQAVAKCLSEILRKTDVLGRFGGDEFLILLPETGLEGAVKVSNQLRGEIERLQVETEEGEVLSVTICVGLVSVRELMGVELPTRNDLIRSADRALYRAKQTGRNQVVAGSGLLT